MKNILLAIASFLVTSVVLFQVAYASDDDGWPPRDEAKNPPSTMPEKGTTEEGTNLYNPAAFHNSTAGKIADKSTHPEVCDACLPNTVGTEMRKNTLPSSQSSGTGSGTGVAPAPAKAK